MSRRWANTEAEVQRDRLADLGRIVVVHEDTAARVNNDEGKEREVEVADVLKAVSHQLNEAARRVDKDIASRDTLKNKG